MLQKNAKWVIGIVVALLVGCGAGYFLRGSFGGASSPLAKTTLKESDLGTVLASYTLDGKSTNVTAKEVLEQQGDLSSLKKEDGTYAIPSADSVMGYIRNQILSNEAAKRNITASDDEVKSFAKENLQTDDISALAQSYGMSEDAITKLIKQSAVMKKLQEAVVKTKVGEAPTAPTQPADDQKDTPTKEYADYIIKLAGDEWDASKGAWKDENGTYASALKGLQISNDSATYDAAMQAYYVAYNQYSQSQSAVSSEWTNFTNELFQKVTINLNNALV